MQSLKNIASLASPLAQASVTNIENDINTKIAPALSDLVTTIDSYPTSTWTLDQARVVQAAATNLEIALDATALDISTTPYPLPTTDAQTLLSLFQGLLPNIRKASTDIITRKDAINDIPTPGVPLLVQENYTLLSASTGGLTTAFVDRVPTSVVPDAEQLQSDINDAFDDVMAVFT